MAPAAQQQIGFAELPVPVKLLLLGMMLGVLSAVYYFALHMSLVEEIENAEQRYVALQGEMRQAQQRQEEFLRLTQELAAREGIDRQNKRVLPEKAEIAAFLQDLDRLAELSGLEIHLVEPRPEEPEQMYIRIPVNLRLRGRYHQVAKFFFNVGKLERVVNMENVHISDPKVEGTDVVLDISVLATTFRRQPDEASGQAPGDQEGGGGMQEGGMR